MEINTQGEKLTKTGEYVAINELITGSHTALQSAGTPVSELPEGTFLYSGTAIIRKGSDKNMQGKGAFQMTADFQKMRSESMPSRLLMLTTILPACILAQIR